MVSYYMTPPAPAKAVTRLNDAERRLWILNDEGLYRWHRWSRQPLNVFIRANRAELDRLILAARESRSLHFPVGKFFGYAKES